MQMNFRRSFNRVRLYKLWGGILMIGLILSWGGMASAADKKHGTIMVKNAWVRAVPPVSKNSAAYMIVENHGARKDHLLSVETQMAEVVEMHEVVKKGSMSSMQPVQHIVVPAHGTVELRPGGLHLMLINLKESIKEGSPAEIILKFEHAGEVKVQAKVLPGQMDQDHDASKEQNVEHDH